MMEASKENSNFAFDRYDTYDWYLALGPLAQRATRSTCKDGRSRRGTTSCAHPNYDAFWQRQTMKPLPHARHGADAQRGRVVGPGGLLRAASRSTRRSRSTTRGPELPRRRAVEPRRLEQRSRHRRSARSTSAAPPASTSAQRIQAPFFAHYLKDTRRLQAGRGDRIRSRGATGGARSTRGHPRKPRPRRSTSTPTDASRSTPPAARDSTGVDRYVTDPAQPVPYRQRPIEPTYFPKGSKWRTWLAARTSASWTTGPMCSAGRPTRSPRTW